MYRKIILLLVSFVIFFQATAQNNLKLSSLQFSENGYILVNEQKQPFYWLGDTAWE